MEAGMKKEGKRKKRIVGSGGRILVCGVIGFGIGFLGAMGLERGGVRLSLGGMIGILVLMAAAYYLQLMIHEGGHLIFGVATGYRFSSFRIGSLMLMKTEGKYKRKRMSVAGTGGQCLMLPPEYREDFPVVLYNLGGSLWNLLTGGVCLAVFFGISVVWLKIFFLWMGVFGILVGLLNGIPMRLGGIDNDGKNIQSALKNKERRRAFWLQLQVSGKQAENVRLKDLPDEWFVFSEEETGDSLSDGVMVLAMGRLIDAHRFEEAEMLGERILEKKESLLSIYRYSVEGEMLFLELIGRRRKEMVDKCNSPEYQKWQKAMKNFPSVLRQQYAYALLYEEDGEKAGKIREKFEKAAKTYPYEGDLELERELMEIVDAHQSL